MTKVLGADQFATDVHRKVLLPYPRTFQDCRSWAVQSGVNYDVALSRFIWYCVLRVVANDRALSDRLILRGGGALWLRYGATRPFPDLDFLCEGLAQSPDRDARNAMQDEVARALNRELFKFFPPSSRWQDYLLQVVNIDIAAAIPPVPYRAIQLAFEDRERIRVVDIERIVAEKFAALVYRASRGRAQEKHVGDLAYIYQGYHQQLNRQKLVQIALSQPSANSMML